MKWFFITDNAGEPKSYFKGHCVSEELLALLKDNLSSRGLASMDVQPIEKYSTSLPGIAMIDRKWVWFEIDELKVGFPAQDFVFFFDAMKELKIRTGSYYKLHGHRSCICFTPAQRAAALKKMGELLPEANRLGKADDKEFDGRLSKKPHPNVKVMARQMRRSLYDLDRED